MLHSVYFIFIFVDSLSLLYVKCRRLHANLSVMLHKSLMIKYKYLFILCILLGISLYFFFLPPLLLVDTNGEMGVGVCVCLGPGDHQVEIPEQMMKTCVVSQKVVLGPRVSTNETHNKQFDDERWCNVSLSHAEPSPSTAESKIKNNAHIRLMYIISNVKWIFFSLHHFSTSRFFFSVCFVLCECSTVIVIMLEISLAHGELFNRSFLSFFF